MGPTNKGNKPAVGRDAREPNTAWLLLWGRFGVKHCNSKNLKNRNAKPIEELGQDF